VEEIKNQTTEAKSEKGLLRQFGPSGSKGGLKEILLPAVIILVIILAGAGTGYLLANRGIGSLAGEKMIKSGEKTVSGPDEMGVKDEKSFPDKAQGRIEINDSKEILEGSHKLIRPGGESQTAYLTSTVVDLNQFTGKCVEIWGETFAAQKAAWLMDVGFVRRLDKCPEDL